jgi:hypothetical protein
MPIGRELFPGGGEFARLAKEGKQAVVQKTFGALAQAHRFDQE